MCFGFFMYAGGVRLAEAKAHFEAADKRSEEFKGLLAMDSEARRDMDMTGTMSPTVKLSSQQEGRSLFYH